MPNPSDRPVVLVIDDEPKIARLIRHTLTSEGYDVLHALDGIIGLSMLEAAMPAVVLLDVMMPHMSGLQVCKRIRELSDVPVIMLTALGDESDRIRGLDTGADDYVVKPFSPGELSARIRAILRRIRSSDEESIPAFDDGVLHIDFDQRQVTRDGQDLRLSRTELRLLRILASTPGRVIFHNELLVRVWGEDYGASNEQLRTYIKYLRRKIEPQPNTPRYILTQLGVGYYFQATTNRAAR